MSRRRRRCVMIAHHPHSAAGIAAQFTLTLGGHWMGQEAGELRPGSSPFTQPLPRAGGLGHQRKLLHLSCQSHLKAERQCLGLHQPLDRYKSGGYNSGGGTPSLSSSAAAGKLIWTKRLVSIRNREKLRIRNQVARARPRAEGQCHLLSDEHWRLLGLSPPSLVLRKCH